MVTPQRPLFRAYQQDPEAVRTWLEEEYPAIQKLARQENGTTWARRGQTPVVRTTGSRFGLNMLSAISAKGLFRFMVVEGRVNGQVFVDFLERLIHKQERPVFLIVDNHPTHRAKMATQFVDSTEGKLRLFYLPPYSPELNPDESVWRHVKHHNLGQQVVRSKAHLKDLVINCLRSLQRTPRLICGFYCAPSFRYAL
jgi:transposase